MTLRDGMHPKRHRITLEQMVAVATALDAAGVPLIEVTHGDGLGGASINYGFPRCTDEEYLRAVVPHMKRARVSALLLPGIGTVEHLRMAADLRRHAPSASPPTAPRPTSPGSTSAWRASSALDTVGFLMMAHMAPPEALLAQARLMESYGANCVYCTDSAGYMLPGRRDRAHRGPARRAPPGDRDRLPRAPQPQPGRRQLPRRHRGRRRAASTPPPPGSAPARGTRRSRCSSPCSTAWAPSTASTSTR